MIISAPILTRLYSPEDFGLAALFTAVVSSFSPAICGKYEVAIVVANSIQRSKQLLGVAFLVALALSTLAYVIVWFYGDLLIRLFSASSLEGWILLVPVALLFSGILKGMTYYSNRLHEYRVISQSKVLVSLISVVGSVTFGLVDFRYGLIVSAVLATIGVSIWLLYRYRNIFDASVIRWDKRKYALIRDYRHLPLYNATTSLLDGVTLALPVIFLSRYFSEAVVGYYALMLRVALGPISFISSSVSQVNLKKVADLVNQRQQVRPYLLKLTLVLVTVVTPLMLLLMLYAPPFFSWVFGEQWRVAGTYIQILAPALALQFVATTVSTTFGATGNNRLGATWKVIAFLVTVSVLVIVAPRVDVLGMFVALMLTNLFLYGLYLFLAWRAAGHPLNYR